MHENVEVTTVNGALDIRLERLNADKTRKDFGSERIYHVYFELSAHPTSAWRDLFAREWKRLNQTQVAIIDGAFLVLHCQLHDVPAALLPELKKAVAETNEAYKEYAQREAMALEHREEVWKTERKDVNAMAASLHFE